MKPNQQFLLKFSVLLVVGFLVVTSGPVESHLITPMTAALARISALILNLIGEGVTVAGTVISSPHFSVQILNGCNGVEAMLILLASMVSFPATWAGRIIGLIMGTISIQLLNLIRIVSLFWLGAYHRSVFDLFHSAIWQVLIILASLGIFLLWARRFGTGRLALSS